MTPDTAADAGPGPVADAGSGSVSDAGSGSVADAAPDTVPDAAPGVASDSATAGGPSGPARKGGNRATVRLAFPDTEAARTALAALAPDNEGHLHAVVDGDTLVLTGDSGSIMGLLRTLDDVLGCVRALGHD